ncbi:hypothetical protein [Saccharomonospora sp.]|uniref:hypothetical protein n=1 Tax=Saccharomonospora sp. TaxID=33913 RepID=UPI002629B847|nr:hypothetical protein [Saccharomonospora sp.]
MSTARAVAAVCAAFMLGACGASSAGGDVETAAPTRDVTSSQPPSTTTTPALPSGALAFGSEHRFPSGLVVSVSSPSVFEPSENAYPRSERAAAFSISLYNESEKPYRLSDFSVQATIDGKEVEQVNDSLRGYNGIVEPDRNISSGESTELTLAFAVEPDPRQLRLTLHPDSAKPTKAVFVGLT